MKFEFTHFNRHRLYCSLLSPDLFFSVGFFLHTHTHTHTDGRIPRTSDYPVTRLLPTRRINAHTDIHALSGIRTQGPSFRAKVDRVASVNLVWNSVLKNMRTWDRQCFHASVAVFCFLCLHSVIIHVVCVLGASSQQSVT
jgi:hypothetical protein